MPQVIVATNKGEPLVLQKQMSLSGVAFENAARRLVGKQDYFVDMEGGNKVRCRGWAVESQIVNMLAECPHPPCLSSWCRHAVRSMLSSFYVALMTCRPSSSVLAKAFLVAATKLSYRLPGGAQGSRDPSCEGH